MTDEELLIAARKYEKLITKLESGRIQKSIDDAVKAVHDPENADNLMCLQNAYLNLALGKLIFGWSMDEMTQRLGELQ